VGKLERAVLENGAEQAAIRALIAERTDVGGVSLAQPGSAQWQRNARTSDDRVAD
jgi:hypothetical protein